MKKITLMDGGLAVLSGFILTASFAPIDLDWLAWVHLIPLLVSLKDKSPLGALKLGLLAGLSHYLTLIYWIVVVLSHYGNLNVVLALMLLLLLSFYLALYSGIFAFCFVSLGGNSLSSFWGASIWVALEYARAHIMSGFPWCLLGYSQYLKLSLIQIADVTGIYGVSFVIIVVNLALYKTFSHFKKNKSARIEIILSFLLVACILAYGYHSMKEKTESNSEGRAIRALIIQGNIDQSIKWNPDYQKRTLAIYSELSERSADFDPQVIIWPETALPFFFQYGSPLSQQVLKVAKTTHSTVLFGSPAYLKEKGKVLLYNRAYVISEERLLGYYDKVHLVPFGEYVPLKRYLPFVHRLVPAAGDFSPGRKLKPITTPDSHLGVLICFEAIFPNIARRLTMEGTELLVNITNDAWFGRTSAPYQHLSMAVFRCVENGLPMARAANTGISALILPTGRVVNKTGLFSRAVLKGELKLKSNKTFYSQYGDIFAILIIISTTLRCFYMLITRRRHNHVLYRDSREDRFPQ